MTELRYHYIYITIPGVRRPPESRRKEDDEVETWWDKIVGNIKDPTKKAQLEELKQKIRQIQDVIGRIPSKGLRDMLQKALAKIMMVADRDPGEALKMASELLVVAQKCEEICRKVIDNCNALEKAAGVAGPAGKLCKLMAKAARSALDNCRSMEDAQQVLELTNRAVEIMHEIAGKDPTSREYKELMNELKACFGDITALDDMGAGDADNMNGVAFGTNQLTAKVMSTLAERAKDSIELDELDQFEKKIRRSLENLRKVPNADKLRGEIEALLRQSLETGVKSVMADAEALAQKAEQMGKLDQVLTKKAERLATMSTKLDGPAKALVDGLVAKIAAARADAATPDAMLALDKDLMSAMLLAEKLAAGGAKGAAVVRDPAYRELLAIDRKLGGAEGQATGSTGGPSMGRDAFNGGAGRPGAATRNLSANGTRPLQPPGQAAGQAPEAKGSKPEGDDFDWDSLKLPDFEHMIRAVEPSGQSGAGGGSQSPRK